MRPPVAFRKPERSPRPSVDPPHGYLWELPAGLVEPSEQSEEGLRHAARREIFEELGFDVALEALSELGPSVFPVPAFIAEVVRSARPGTTLRVTYLHRGRGQTMTTAMQVVADPELALTPVEQTGQTLTDAQRRFREAWLRSRAGNTF